MSSTTTTSGSERASARRGFAALAVVIVAILCALLPSNADAAKANQRPPAPTSVKVLPVGQSRFHLSWGHVRRAVGYHVYNSGRLVGKVRRTGFTTAPLRRAGVHVYTVRSISGRGVL